MSASFPCHHPAWPRFCPECQTRVEGLNVTLGPREADLALPHDMRWGTNGACCYRCNLVAIGEPPTKPFSPAIRATVVQKCRETLGSRMRIMFVEPLQIAEPKPAAATSPTAG